MAVGGFVREPGGIFDPQRGGCIAERDCGEHNRYASECRGHYTLEFARYEEAPANVAQKVIEESTMTDDDED